MKKNICILYGGKSGEHEISKQSAASIVAHINREKYNIIAIGIKKNGTWYLQKEIKIVEDPARGNMLEIIEGNASLQFKPGKGIFSDTQPLKIDIVFPVLHGSYGEDGTVQGLLEILNLPYVGAGVLGSSLSMDKEKVKMQWQAAGLPIVDFLTVYKHDFYASNKMRNKIISQIENQFQYPLFVKPVCAGSSLGVKKAESSNYLILAIENGFKYDIKILIERAIAAREIECSVIGNHEPRAFPPGEVIPSHAFYSYEAKYLDPQGAKLKIPADIPQTVAKQVVNIALKAYKIASVSGFARVDLFYEQNTEKIYLNEINTIPGFTNISMFPRMCAAAGLKFSTLIDTLIKYGFSYYNEKANLKYSYD